jgi:hypothetical protein
VPSAFVMCRSSNYDFIAERRPLEWRSDSTRAPGVGWAMPDSDERRLGEALPAPHRQPISLALLKETPQLAEPLRHIGEYTTQGSDVNVFSPVKIH